MSKKILFIYYKLFKPGGVARVLVSLANQLVEQGYDVSILLMMSNTDCFYPLDSRVKIVHIDSFSHWGFTKINVGIDKYFRKLPARQNIKNYVYDFGQWEMLSKWLKQNHLNYDLVISSWYKLSAQIAQNKAIAAKTIAWEHANFEVGGKLWKDLLRKNYKNFKAVVCLNSPSLAHYKQINNQSFLIANLIGFPFENFVSEKIENKKNDLIFVGRLDSDKNVQESLEILKNVNLKNFKFKIIGDGPTKSKLEKYLEDNTDLKNKVELLGAKNLDEIYEALSNSKAFLFTSKTECLPTVLIEANLTANALISYDCKYGPSDIVNQQNGYLIPMHDKEMFAEKLQYLIDNPYVLEELNKSSYRESAKWRKDKIIQQWKNLIDN
ncbi:Glycosyltransferase involved in cell wall bisynthesis [Soonwooa buanensis]|uniref:Glycosyltransferase involved in cell wall bisynthesis n=1 Tax=Soonwooa buanensis TaxID=619805 RepID=A0A1T5EAU9_9FLAO|nr:glycosyltransferase [Soonwooa buanensis]SKB81157.1 Glycosyltransferase involved in cell wall bisynthesis [Soonwooa buanensis]